MSRAPADGDQGLSVADAGWADLVFGYGSLMWNPGFRHDAFEPAMLEGWSRALCVYSEHYRGTPRDRAW